MDTQKRKLRILSAVITWSILVVSFAIKAVTLFFNPDKSLESMMIRVLYPLFLLLVATVWASFSWQKYDGQYISDRQTRWLAVFMVVALSGGVIYLALAVW